MGLVLFVVFVAACALVLYKVTRKSEKKVDVAHQRKLRERKARAQMLETPAVYTLARPDQPWHTRRQPAKRSGSRPEPFAPRFESNDPHYDGYSRRDRHRIADVEILIEDEKHLEDIETGRTERQRKEGLAK